jgi:aryl-alcohol dehydrogenase-like predicted oxidoreductase
VSNFTRENLEAYQELRKAGYPPVIAVQNRFNILEGPNSNEEGVLDFCAKNEIGFIPYTPLGAGLLTERYLDPGKTGKGDRLVDEGLLEALATEDNLAKLRKFRDLAREGGYEMAELALAYMLGLPGLASVIPSVSNTKQLESNARAGTIELSPEQRRMIGSIFAG